MAPKNVYSVGQVNSYIRRMFSEDYLLRSILVRGEVSNCKYHTSGHIYFTLKDASGTLPCVMFAGRAQRGLSFKMKEGDAVVVMGSVEVYEKTGSYQLYAERIIRDGVGLLNERFELLKKKLEEMGMFAEQYKKPIPRYIRRLGVVTAPTGAAVRDIINIATRRNPYVQIILYPAIVQGEEAPASIIKGIRALDQANVDTIIIGRGGGSLEDLWAFNEEIVAEAVFECNTPIISAVGHETDTVITDYVADLRAPTPSAAAELAVFEYSEYKAQLEAYKGALDQAMFRRLRRMRERTLSLQKELFHLSPANRIREKRMRAISLEEHIQAAMADKIQFWRRRIDLQERFSADIRFSIQSTRHRMELLAARMERSSPVARLAGSYGFISDENGAGIRAAAVHTGDVIHIRMRDGSLKAGVTEVEVDGKAQHDGNQ